VAGVARWEHQTSERSCQEHPRSSRTPGLHRPSPRRLAQAVRASAVVGRTGARDGRAAQPRPARGRAHERPPRHGPLHRQRRRQLL